MSQSVSARDWRPPVQTSPAAHGYPKLGEHPTAAQCIRRAQKEACPSSGLSLIPTLPCAFPRAQVTEEQKLSSLTQQKSVIVERPQWASCHSHLPPFQLPGLLTFLGLWPQNPGLCYIFFFLLCSSLCVFLEGQLSPDLGSAWIIQNDLFLKFLITSKVSLTPNRFMFTGLGPWLLSIALRGTFSPLANGVWLGTLPLWG